MLLDPDETGRVSGGVINETVLDEDSDPSSDILEPTQVF